MKITCLQENLKKAINIVERIIGRNLTLPVLNNILLSAEKNKLRISSTNLEIGINCWIPGKTDKEGSITVPSKLVSGLINNLSNKKIELTAKSNNKLMIKSEDFIANINGISSDEFPIIPKINDKPLINIKGNLLKNSLLQVVEMASISESRPEISGVYVNFDSLTGESDKNCVNLVATDSFRLAEKNIFFENEAEIIKNQQIIIPQRTAQELARILNETNSDVKIILSGNQILFDLDDIQIISRLIEGQYPDYKQIIPGNFKTRAIVNRDELIKSIKVASLFSSKINDVKFNIDPKKSLINISAKDSDIGENKSQIDSKIEGNGLEIIFNYRYLLDGLNNILSDKVILEFNNSSSSAVIKPVGDASYVYVIMPIKI
ncbi:DNA polymerase III subunit beta [Patescibacteria group bacterium]